MLSKALARVTWLDLNGNQLGDEGPAAIAAADGGLPRIKLLELVRNRISAAGVQSLASAFAGGAFRQLVGLYLNDNPIGDAGLIAFAEALEKGALPELRTLHVYHCQIGDDGLKALPRRLAVDGWRSSRSSESTSNEFGVQVVNALVDAIDKGDLPSLKRLFMDLQHRANPRLRAACEKRNSVISVK